MLALSQLCSYDAILIQCHNNPDVDSIGSGYALYRYFEEKSIPVRLIYTGFSQVTKPNISEFVRLLSIPLQYVPGDVRDVTALVPEARRPLLITVDCQYGAGNVGKIAAENVCVVDHHLRENSLPELTVLEPYLGSCATVVWRLLSKAGYDFTANKDVSTALYYALYTDTNSLSEISHPIDRDMLESLDYDASLVRHLKNNNLTREELLIAGKALMETRHDAAINASLFMAEPCDPNILGFISDLTMQAQGVDICVGCCAVNAGVKLSIRSATYEVMANELASHLTQGVGSGGGNKEKAGGFFRLAGEQAHPLDYLAGRLRLYFSSYDKLVAGEHKPDLSRMIPYRKNPLPVGFAVLTDIFPKDTQVFIRTLEGDASFTVTDTSYVMIGIRGEAYPIERGRFEKNYQVLPGTFSFWPEIVGDDFYMPTVKERVMEKSIDLIQYAKPCVAKGEQLIYAVPLEKNTKIFSKWYKEGYMSGKPGDYLAVTQDDPEDIYVINRDIFHHTYERAAHL